MHHARRRARACLLTAAAIATAATAASPAALAAPADVPTPTVTGPLPVTATSRPFLATDQDLAKYGYVEREYHVSGAASTYSPTNTLSTAAKVTTGGPNGDGTYPYKTRIVVRRPASAADFNGTTLLEWNNVTAGFDIEWNWLNDPDYLMRHGYAWVGVSAQAAGVLAPGVGLKAWDPARYGDLNVSTAPGDGDVLSYDIFGAVAKAIRGLGNGRDPLGGLQSERILATGESQSGSRLNVYYNAIQPLHRIVDAFLITVAGGSPPTIPNAAPGVLRTDTPETKAIRVLSERENLTSAPPTDPDHAAYRRWDVAGGSHLPFKAYMTFAPIVARDVPVPATADCTKPALSRVAWPYVYNRAIEALVTWQRGGAAPPNAPRMEYDAGALKRDALGNAVGGIRLPEMEVPTATSNGDNTAITQPATGFSRFCGLLGSSVPFTQTELDSLYDDYGAYVDAVAPKTAAVRAAGFVTADDVERIDADAARFARLRPEEPKLAGGAGAPTLTWRGPEPVSTATTYEVQRRSSAAGAQWTTVAGAGALAARQLTIAGDAEGTNSYRVRSTTVVPPLYPDPQRIETTGWSDELRGVKIDRTAPAAPVVTPARPPEHAGDGGWFKDGVSVGFAPTADPQLADGTPGTGLDATSVPAAVAVTATQTLAGTVKDLAGNTSPTATRTIQVDATAPELSVDCPTGVFVGDDAAATVAASDGGSGLAQDPSGAAPVDTSAPGPRTIARTATDRVGHTTTAACTVAVRALPANGANGTNGAPGTPGAPGAKGDAGPKGAPGPRGRAGRAAKVTCRTSGRKRVKVTCAVKLAGGATAAKVRLSRGGRTVTTRSVRRSGTVTLGSRLAKGRYDLTVTIDGATTQRRRLTV